jgi:hypothetical protein
MSNATAVADFERQLRADIEQVFSRTVPRGVVGIALELRQQIEDNAPVGVRAFEPGPNARPSSRRRPGTLKSRISAGKGPLLKTGRHDPGHAAAEAALADWKIGEPILVVADVYYASFVEKGTEKMAARPFVRPALDLVGNREVRE